MAKRVFLIDDEVEMTQLVSALLTFNGFEMASANDSRGGLSRLLEEDFDAVIVDLMMPGMDGISLIERLRQSERHGKTPIVAMSGRLLDDREHQKLVDSGVRFVTKPVSPTRLVEIVRDVVA